MISPITIKVPSIIEFGIGKLSTLNKHVQGCKKVFFLLDSSIEDKIAPYIDELEQCGIMLSICTDVVPEPSFEVAEKLITRVKAFLPDAVVGIGGGSTMDLAKILSTLVTVEQPVKEIVTKEIPQRKIKLICATTTAGTGSEITPVAVLTDVEQKLKKGVASQSFLPDVAIVDPELTLTLPASITAATGMDALTHCIEAYTNCYAHPIIDNIAIEGIRLIAANLEKTVKYGDNLDSRTAVALGSLYGGMCVGSVNTAATHALAYPLGGEFKVSHGVANSTLLPFVMDFNLPECVEKYAKVAIAMNVSPHNSKEFLAKQAIYKVRKISSNCGIPQSLQDLHIPESALSSMAKLAIDVTRLLNNNPRRVGIEDAVDIYRRAYLGVIE